MAQIVDYTNETNSQLTIGSYTFPALGEIVFNNGVGDPLLDAQVGFKLTKRVDGVESKDLSIVRWKDSTGAVLVKPDGSDLTPGGGGGSNGALPLKFYECVNARSTSPTTAVTIGATIPGAQTATVWTAGQLRLHTTTGDIYEVQSDGSFTLKYAMVDNTVRMVNVIYAIGNMQSIRHGISVFIKENGILTTSPNLQEQLSSAFVTHSGSSLSAYLSEIAPQMGEMKMRAGSAVPPAKWLLCDGAAVSRTTYSGLFSIIGTDYGSGDGSTTFNLPDMRQGLPAGKGSYTDGTYAVTSTGSRLQANAAVINVQSGAATASNIAIVGVNYIIYAGV